MQLVLFHILIVALGAAAFPDFERCNVGTWVAGGVFNQVGIATYSDGGATDCVITGVPNTFSPCDSFILTLTSTIDLGHKVGSSIGTLSNAEIATTKQKANCRHSSTNKQTQTKYRWTAPPGNEGNVTFTALCGDMKTNLVLFAARPQISAPNATGAVFQNGCPFDANAEADPPPTNTAQLVQDNIPLMAGIGGVVVVGLAAAGLFAYRRNSKKGSAETVVERLEDVGNTIKQRMQSIRPPAANGFAPMSKPQNQMMTPYQQGYGNQNGAMMYGQQQAPQQQQFRNPNPQQGASMYQYGAPQSYQSGPSRSGYPQNAVQQNGNVGYNMQQQQQFGQRQQPYGMNYNLSAQNPAFGQ